MNRTCFAAIVASLALAAGANADIVSFTSNNAASSNNLASFSGTLNYNVINSITATITLNVNNTTPLANGGFLTGVVLANVNQFSALTITLTSTSDGDFTDTFSETASPFGTFKGGAALGSNWLGGGTPSAGVGIGDSLTLTFSVTGNGAGFISATSFVTPVNGDQQMVFRFRGFAGGSSDKVPTMLTQVPTPGAAALAAMGGLLMTGRRRRA